MEAVRTVDPGRLHRLQLNEDLHHPLPLHTDTIRALLSGSLPIKDINVMMIWFIDHLLSIKVILRQDNTTEISAVPVEWEAQRSPLQSRGLPSPPTTVHGVRLHSQSPNKGLPLT